MNPMVSLADFQTRAKTNFSRQEPMFHRRIFKVSKFMQELWIVDSLRDSASFRRLKFRAKYRSRSHIELSTNFNRHLRSCLHSSLAWTYSERLICVFPQINKVDSIYIICRSLVEANSLWIFYHRFPIVFYCITTEQSVRPWVCRDWNYKSTKPRRFKVVFDL